MWWGPRSRFVDLDLGYLGWNNSKLFYTPGKYGEGETEIFCHKKEQILVFFGWYGGNFKKSDLISGLFFCF